MLPWCSGIFNGSNKQDSISAGCSLSQSITSQPQTIKSDNTKMNKIMLSVSPSSVFHTVFTMLELKANKHFILIEVLVSLTKI